MSSAPAPSGSAGPAQRLLLERHAPLPWAGFLLVHAALVALALTVGREALGDLERYYRAWADQAVQGQGLVGVGAPWVYPALALAPILLPLLAGPAGYLAGWFATVTAFDALGFAVLVHGRPARGRAAAWWWLAFLLLLGPVALARLDAVAAALAVLALALLAVRPAVAGALLAAGAWIKVWPGVLWAGALAAARRRGRILAGGAVLGVAVLAAGLAAGDAADVFGFVSAQSGRGLQVEAPFAGPWLWLAAAGHGRVFFDEALSTYQVQGPGTDLAAGILAFVQPAVVLALLLVGVLARRSGRAEGSERAFAPLALALVAGLVVFDKVGSPQYVAWLAAPVVYGILVAGRRFLVPAVLAGTAAALTQLVYPDLYDAVLALHPAMLAVLGLRNLLLVAVFAWAVRESRRKDRRP